VGTAARSAQPIRPAGRRRRSHPLEPAGRRRGLVALIAVAPARALPAAVDPAAARQAAQEVLDDAKYHPPDVPRPFQGILEWLADRLRPVADALYDAFEPVLELFDRVPGGRFILAAIGIGALALLIHWMISRRSRAAVSGAGSVGLVDLRADPAALEREATDAEAAGQYDLAVRRRFEAGLLRLVRAERLTLRAETTAGAAARQVGSPVMDGLTADFEEIVYGAREATADDAAQARTGWTELLGVGARR
jgi:hypothetical protein